MIQVQNSNEKQCLKYVNNFFSCNIFSIENKVNEFCDAYKHVGVIETENNYIFNFFCSYIIRTRDIDEEVKKLIKDLKAFEKSRVKNWKSYCQSVFEYIVENEILINDNMVFLLHNEIMNSQLMNKYISLLVNSEMRILDYVKYDENINDHISLYCDEFFSDYIWMKTDKFDKYRYFEMYISEKEKITLIDKILESDRLDVLYVTKFENVIRGLRCIKEIESNVTVKNYIEHSINTLIEERAESIQGDEYKSRLQTIELPIEIPNEYFEEMKIIDTNFLNFMKFLNVPDFFSTSESMINSLVNYNVFDQHTGFIKNEVSNTEFIRYMNDGKVNIKMSTLQTYGKLIKISIDMLQHGISEYVDFQKFRNEFTNDIQTIFLCDFSEHFVFSVAGATFLAVSIEVVLKDIHEKYFEPKETNFEMLKDFYESDYISKDELFYIMYVLYDENGWNLRNDLCHGNYRFDLNESTYCYVLFKIFFIIATAIERGEEKC